MVRHRSKAVDKFSSMMGKIMIALIVSIYLKALLSAPFSFCMALRICATASTSVPLAISEGWNWMPTRLIHLDAPLVD